MNDRGRVVFVTSENVAQPYPDEVVYNASKSPVLNFAKGGRQVHAQKGTLIDCIAPAVIATDMTDGLMEKRSEEKGRELRRGHRGPSRGRASASGAGTARAARESGIRDRVPLLGADELFERVELARGWPRRAGHMI